MKHFVGLTAIIIIAAIVLGWILNLVTVISMMLTSDLVWGVEEVLHTVGVFVVPLGVLMGYM